MKRRPVPAHLSLVLAIIVAVIAVPTFAQTLRSYSFRGAPKDGGLPNGGLIRDAQGNFYGVTAQGGPITSQCSEGCGSVYEFSQDQSGAWSEKVIYSFTGLNGVSAPTGSLILDTQGNLYGVTAQDPGVVFELTPGSNGAWNESIIYTFSGEPPNGSIPTGGLVFDAGGNLYGATRSGGLCTQYGCTGIIFKLSPAQNGNWTDDTIYVFQSDQDGEFAGPLAIGPDGSLYGTTLTGGTGLVCACGTTFQLEFLNGVWVKNILYSFTGGLDGNEPTGPVTFDSAGNLFGETNLGGSLACPTQGCGVVYELSPGTGNVWTFNVMHAFNGVNGILGAYPSGGLAMDADGNLYGTTSGGGNLAYCGGYGCGTIFELSPQVNAPWKFSLFRNFNGANGWSPEYGVLLGNDGRLYGTTFAGGKYERCGSSNGSCGTAFVLTP